MTLVDVLPSCLAIRVHGSSHYQLWPVSSASLEREVPHRLVWECQPGSRSQTVLQIGFRPDDQHWVVYVP
jgi:hypothetical protein